MTANRKSQDVEDTETGTCDFCDKTFQVGSQLDHCGECGNCFEHCTDAVAHFDLIEEQNKNDL